MGLRDGFPGHSRFRKALFDGVESQEVARAIPRFDQAVRIK